MVVSAECTILIRARNARVDLKILFSRIKNQIDRPIEVIVVDNESDDGTRQLAQEFGAKIIDISSSDFTWGRALNWGMAAASGRVVIILSTDAWPIGNGWFSAILDCFKDDQVGAVYGRQVPRPDAPLDEWIRVKRVFPIGDRCWDKNDVIDGKISGLIASNSFAALRRNVWEKYKFDEESLGAEELPWVRSVVMGSYTVHYTDSAVVEHSHRETARRLAMRLWELHVQAHRNAGRKVHIIDIARLGAGFTKRRLRNIFVRGIGFGKKIEGIYRLPWEVVTIMLVSVRAMKNDRVKSLHQKW